MRLSREVNEVEMLQTRELLQGRRKKVEQIQGSNFKRRHAATLLAGLAFLLLESAAGRAQSGDNDGCSNATLAGDYAFTISGQIFVPNGPTIQREGIAMSHFDGAGNLSQVDFVLSSPNAVAPPGFSLPIDPVTGFHVQEKGTYTVYSDCTGTFIINFPPATSSIGPIPGALIVAKFVLSNGGRSIHTIVTSLTPPGAPGPIPALIRSEGHKLQPLLTD
jgi:hypothetical protein